MRAFTRFFVFFSIFAIATVTSKAQTNQRPSAFVLPIKKHEPTQQFFTSLDVGTPRRSSLNLVLDLNSNLTWLNCHRRNSSTLRQTRCRSSVCSAVPGDGCEGGFCSRRLRSPLSGKPVAGRISQERISFHSTPSTFGDKTIVRVSVRPFTLLMYRISFHSTPSTFGDKTIVRVSVRPFTFLGAADPGVAPPAVGVVGLAGSAISLPAQVTSAFNVIRKFALCLPSYGTGRFYIGAALYDFPPLTESPPLTLTPFGKHPGSGAGDYFISVSSISVDGDVIAVNGGTKISTVTPYTVLHSDVYRALALSFENIAKAMGIRKAPAVAPFMDCFDASSVRKNAIGPNVPAVDFVVPGRIGNVKWRFYGANSMVKANEKVMCLAFVDGGTKSDNSITIGTHQLQNHLVEFDLTTSVFGFSESLLLHNTSCSS
ncbi:PREDICTED: LOW QUALITY PROTEIN: basic 7S globulin 2 [Tarenaya hassleriana]|uniref:LOW QUALITY PROTEIN: basic 7S globulin 2 n=1 Tax=Tarenaya hassleriana TaxID=28532 RepID=UPI00053C3811|nr:PREDICTED: LOW QUALITY PROTEIN: basic 7S globulin 2 [Tarenaya hassleriana]